MMKIPSLLAPRRGAPLLAAAVLIAPAFSQEEAIPAHPAKPLLWKVEGDHLEKPSFLFGTLHLGIEPVATLHPAAQEAFDAADVVHTEIPLDEEEQVQIAAQMLRGDGKILKQAIGDGLHEKLVEELKLIHPELNALPFQVLKTWAVAVSLPLLPFQLEGEVALDKILHDRAVAAGKATGALERIEDQVGIFDELTEEEQTILLSETIRGLREDRDQGRNSTRELIDAYVAGDGEALQSQLQREFRKIEESEHKELGRRLMKRIFEDRDRSMAAAIHERLVADPDKTHFFAAGAGHFLGETSIRHHLSERGYTVRRVGD